MTLLISSKILAKNNRNDMEKYNAESSFINRFFWYDSDREFFTRLQHNKNDGAYF